MIKDLFNKLFGETDEKVIAKLNKQVQKINEIEKEYINLTDEQLSQKTQEFKQRLKNGETLDDILVEAFATVREAAKRLLNMRAYDVQLIGGMIIHSGKIAEMKTGEGKTLMSSFPVYLNALTGKGVHVVTVNDYLAKRDRDTMGIIYSFLGLSSGCIIANMSNEERKHSYNCDITYGTNNEFGFDYLRDNMVHDLDEKVQREHNYAIVDEVDSILIDEARTPLIISGAAEETTEWYNVFAHVARQLKRSYKTEKIKDKKNTVIPDNDWEDYEVDEKAKTVTITDKGIKNVEKMLKIENLYDPEHVELTHFLTQALKAKELFKLDRDYIINQKNEVIIVDEFTGRLMDGRRYSDGLHQAIEAKENLEVAGENQTLATITLQNYFRMYNKLSGMTGTAKTEEEEFKQIYNLKVVVVPTNRPVIRKDLTDVIYQTTRAKYKAVVNKIVELFEKGQPVLVGTSSIQNSEYLSSLLKKRNIPHEVLNAKYHEREAEIVAQAGRFKTVTIATNMAGRGTDIKLGGDAHSLALKVGEFGSDEYKEAFEMYEKECEQNRVKVLEAGGLYILGTERHESRRIDNQLRGRAGRQGDPGVSEFYLSTEDELMRLFGGERIQATMKMLKMDEDEEIRFKKISKGVENAQKRVESRNFGIRKSLIEFDDVNNKQREIIYQQRDEILKNHNLRELIFDMLYDTIENYILSSDGDRQILKDKIAESYLYELTDDQINMDDENLLNSLYASLENLYKEKIEIFGDEYFQKIEKYIMLDVLDTKWKENLRNLAELREGINLQSYGQKNPVNEYKILSAEVYNEMIASIKRDTTSFLIRIRVKTQDQEQEQEEDTNDEFVSRRQQRSR